MCEAVNWLLAMETNKSERDVFFFLSKFCEKCARFFTRPPLRTRVPGTIIKKNSYQRLELNDNNSIHSFHSIPFLQIY